MRPFRRPAWYIPAVVVVALTVGCDPRGAALPAPSATEPSAAVGATPRVADASSPGPPSTAPRPAAGDDHRLAAVDDRLGTFDRLTEATGLADRLSTRGPVTVFAPTDAAFASADVVSGGKPDSTLRYHVVPGTITSAELTAGLRLRTWAGDLLTVARARGNTFVLDGTGIPAALLTTDLSSGDITVHVIDRVLVPDVEPRIRVDGPAPNARGR